MPDVDIIGGLIDWLRERDSRLVLDRMTTKFGNKNWINSWFNVRTLRGPHLGQVTLIYPGRIPPGLQYDFRDSDNFGFLYCRKEWLQLYDADIFDEILETAQALREGRRVNWHKWFRYKDGDVTIHRVESPSWPPKFM